MQAWFCETLDGPGFRRLILDGLALVALRPWRTEAQPAELLDQPQLVETDPELCVDVAGWFWAKRNLNALGTIASAGPLLGLLGTVIGMIELFGAQGGGNDPAQLAHGISVALYNTAFGLIVAIPSLMTHRYFKGVVEGYTVSMEEAAERMVPQLMRFCIAR